MKRYDNISQKEYRKTVLDHYENPRNLGLIDKFDFEGSATNKSCEDEVSIRLRINEDVIEEVGIELDACVVCRAFASMFSENIKGEKIRDMRELDEKSFFEIVGFYPRKVRKKCSMVVFHALKNCFD